MKRVISVLVLLLSVASSAQAFDFYWAGNYSVEGNYLSGVDLGNSSDGDKAYINHHLLLRPEIIMYEGLSAHFALDAINGGGSVPPSSRVGQLLGGELSASNPTYASDVPEPFLERQLQKSRGVDINEAYLKYSHTNGELRIGRQPLSFGYGAFYNAGYNPLDHWLTNRDGISYSFNMGSLSFTPMLNFMTSAVRAGEQATEFGLKFNFSVEDTGLDLGFMVLQRHVPQAVNVLNPVPGVTTGAAAPTTYSIFYNRQKKTYRYGFEVLVQDGDAGDGVNLKGLGLAGEAEWNLKKWNFSSKFGYAQGNDPTDGTSISGVAMHRNYNLGMILFNHPLGDSSFDPLGTDVRGRRGALSGAGYTADGVVDTDSISNAMYIAPSVSYDFSSKWNLQTTLVMAWLDETKTLGGELDSFLGSEVDLSLTFNPTKNITYQTTLGFFMPGTAFEGASSNFETKSSFGATTSLGIRF